MFDDFGCVYDLNTEQSRNLVAEELARAAARPYRLREPIMRVVSKPLVRPIRDERDLWAVLNPAE